MKAVIGLALLLSVTIAICGAKPPRGGTGVDRSPPPQSGTGDSPSRGGERRPPQGKTGAYPPPPPPLEGDAAASNDSVTRPPRGGKKDGPRGGFRGRGGKEPFTGEPKDYTEGPRGRHGGKRGSRDHTHGPDYTEGPRRRFDGRRAPRDRTEGPEDHTEGPRGGRPPFRQGKGGRRP